MYPSGCPADATGLSGRTSSLRHALLKAQTQIGQIQSLHNILYDTYRRLKDQAERAQRASTDAPQSPSPAAKGGPASASASPSRSPPERARKPGKLSFKEQREFDGMEARILAAEERKSALEATLADPATYQKAGASVPGMRAELAAVAEDVERLYARWQELEGLKIG